METQKPKIAMYVKRSFGAKLDASFGFVKENWKPLLKYFTYLMLPLCLIQGINMNGLTNTLWNYTALETVGNESVDFFLVQQGLWIIIHYAGALICSVLGAILLSSLTYALIRLYNEREDRLNGITFNDIRPLLKSNVKRMVLAMLLLGFLMIGVVGIVVLLAALSLYTLWLSVTALFIVGVPLALLIPVYLFEDVSFGTAFKKTYRLGLATWGGVFLMVLVMGLIAAVLQGVCSIPWYVIYFIKALFVVSEGGVEGGSSVGLNFIQYLFSILMLYGTYLSTVLTIVGLAYQYGHASEYVDSVTVENDIENFEKL